MKRTEILSFALMLMTLFVQSQGLVDKDKFKIGINAALPLGNAADISSVSLGLDLAYHYGVSKVFDLGFATGFTNAFVNTEEVVVSNFDNPGQPSLIVEQGFDNVQFLPIAGLIRIYPTVRSRVNFGADLGYALGISEGNDGGFYYRPIVAVDIGGGTEITGSYTGISLDGGSWDTVTLGVLFGF